MNYLAHAYLSFDEPKVLIGNFIGDFVRGPIEEIYEKDVVIGILLHREIDSFTDSHPVVKEAQSLLRPIYGRYATVITDMYFDYFLGKYWNNYHHQPLEEYAQYVYKTIEVYKDFLPENFLKTFQYIQYYDWLVTYSELDGIRRAFKGIAKRTKFDSKMETAHIFLDENHDLFRQYFGDFFEDLVKFSKKRLSVLKAEI